MSHVITVDLDSTTCDTRQRHHLIDREGGTTDWDAYSLACVDDVLVEGVAALIRLAHAAGLEVHYVTGRSEAARRETERWLADHLPPYAGLWMDDPTGGDHFERYGSHAAYKAARVQEVADARGGVLFHVDDWPEVQIALQEVGIPCICVRSPQEIAEAVGINSERFAK